MQIEGSKVGIIGGSIAGCAAAIALTRLGCDVTVLERSEGALQDRGMGIVIPPHLLAELVEHAYLSADYACVHQLARRTYVHDGSYYGALKWDFAWQGMANNWGSLWRGLRANLDPAVAYRSGARVQDVVEDDDRVVVVLGDGEALSFDVVVGADGYRSMLRRRLHPQTEPDFADYVLWRGSFSGSRLEHDDGWEEVVDDHAAILVGFDGGHGVAYAIPELDPDTVDELRINWAIYTPTPAGLRAEEPSSIPPGAVTDEWFAELDAVRAECFPPRLRALFTSPRAETTIQPIYDCVVDSYVGERVLLLGDAATVARPHAGVGATKALEDARLLETLGAAYGTWEGLLAAYDQDRTPNGKELVEISRRMGHALVDNTPPWSQMTPDDYEAWMISQITGDTWELAGTEA
ncbi:MAG: FAD-dependent monooxygenase [Acidimicrobiales bacterium]|nr:FAD-dependent monooxygenase [Acidimicrobiales bacterium]